MTEPTPESDDVAHPNRVVSCLATVLGVLTIIGFLLFQLYSCASSTSFTNIDDLVHFCTSNVVQQGRKLAQERGLDPEQTLRTDSVTDAAASDVEKCVTDGHDNVACSDLRPGTRHIECWFKSDPIRQVEIYSSISDEIAKN